MFLNHQIQNMGALPSELWCVILSHVDSGDFGTVEAIRMLCRSINKIVNLYLSDVSNVFHDGITYSVLRNGVEHGESTICKDKHDEAGGVFIIKETYYWGIKHDVQYNKWEWIYASGVRLCEDYQCYRFGAQHGLAWRKRKFEADDDVNLRVDEYVNNERVFYRDYTYDYRYDKFAISDTYRRTIDGSLFYIYIDDAIDNIEYFIIKVPHINEKLKKTKN
jgi:hypothetical protein